MSPQSNDIPMATATLITSDKVMMLLPPTLVTVSPQGSILPNSSDPGSRVCSPTFNDKDIQTLKDQGFTMGLINTIRRNVQTFPMRIWIVDNSGSMTTGDGSRIAETLSTKVVKLVQCTRWSELQQTIEYHANMAALFKAPTVFRLLNDPGRMVGPRELSVGERGDQFLKDDVETVFTTMRKTSPYGCTPLSHHLIEIRRTIIDTMLPQLLATGQKVAVILATDGLPTDAFGSHNSSVRAEFEQNLRSLAGLPVWLVVRLCTNEESVVDYYSNLDTNLEWSLEVIDDWVGEGKEINRHNPWLNYGLCLHRIREMGSHHRLFDLLDERRLNSDELKEFFGLLFGSEEFDGAPDPNLEFNAFMYHVKMVCSRTPHVWNPVKNRMAPWIDLKSLRAHYSPSSCSIM